MMAHFIVGVECVGEWFAECLGITTPRFQYVIDEVITAQREVSERESSEPPTAREAVDTPFLWEHEKARSYAGIHSLSRIPLFLPLCQLEQEREDESLKMAEILERENVALSFIEDGTEGQAGGVGDLRVPQDSIEPMAEDEAPVPSSEVVASQPASRQEIETAQS